MEIEDSIATKYWLLAAMEQVEKNYTTNGYEVDRETRVGSTRADLVARRGDETVVVEFKAGAWTKEKVEATNQLRAYVTRQLKGRFELVWARPPVEREIDVDGLADILTQELQEHQPADLQDLSSNSFVEEVSDLEISFIALKDGRVHIRGEGAVAVQLNYGGSRDGMVVDDAYPFDFDIVLDYDLDLLEVNEITVDTRSFYD